MNSLSTPHPVDQHVGERIRMRRRQMRLTQRDIADRIGVQFQQVQKYEKGVNRISASKLFELSRVLLVSPAYFFMAMTSEQDAALGGPMEEEDMVRRFLGTDEGIELAALFPLVRNQNLRKRLVELIRTLVEDEAIMREHEPSL